MIHQEAHHGSKGLCADSATLTCFDCLAPSFNTSAQSVGSAYGSDVSNVTYIDSSSYSVLFYITQRDGKKSMTLGEVWGGYSGGYYCPPRGVDV
jgi:hypothetical protein